MSNSIEINVTDVIAVNRIRDTEPEVERLAKSMQYVGQLQDIIINQNNRLVGGGRRLAAAKLLGWKTISAKVKDVTDEQADLIEVMENNEREEFSFSEKLKITHMLQNKAGERRGRPKKSDKNLQNIDIVTDKKTVNLREFSNLSKDDIASIAGWGSASTMSFALTIEQNAIPEVIKQIGNKTTTDDEGVKRGGLSIYGAYRISQLPKKKQLHALNEAVTFLDNEGDELSKSNASRRAAKRKDKNKVPKKRLQHLCHRIIRIAPDWDKEILSDIIETPVNDFADPQLAIVAVECWARNLPQAMECLEQWDYEYVTTITVYDPEWIAHHLDFTTGDTAHIVIGMRRGDADPDRVLRFSVNKTPPVIAKTDVDLRDALLPIIENMFPDTKKHRRIDMSSTGPVKNWIVWKITYGDPDAAAEHIAATDAEISAESDSVRATDPVDPETSDGVPIEQQEADLDDLPLSSPDLDGDDEEDLFEPPVKRKPDIFN